MAPFGCFSPETTLFLRDLKANNTKPWLAANKTRYENHIKKPGTQFADAMAAALHDLTGQPHISKIFRIHRDVRFSKDKTPYNAHLHLAFRPDGQAVQPPMWFFGLSPDKLTLGCGVFQYEKAALSGFRNAMAGPKGAELIRLTAALRDAGARIGDPDLKRVPAGFDKDHPQEEALRRKGFSAWIDVGDPAFAVEPNLVKRTSDVFGQLIPVYRLLSQIT